MAPSIEELKNNLKELDSINEKQEKKVRYFETTTIKLVVAYIFSQALIFLSISQNPTISCQHWWIPFCLSSLIAVVFGIAFKRFVGKWERTQYHYDMSFMEKETIYHRIVLLQESQDCSSKQQDMYDHQEKQRPKILKCDVEVYQRRACICLVSLCLVAYTILILMACRSILCHN